MEQIPEIYRLRREGLQKQYDAGEITLSALNTGVANLNIEESAAIERNSDQQLANALSVNQQAIDAINLGISSLENIISQSNDPDEIASLLIQIGTQIPEIYRLRREGLQAQYDKGEITLESLNTGLANLNIEESAAIERNSDQQLANTLQINQEAVDTISTEISDLENAISQSNDPAEIAQLLTQIAEQIPEIYRLRRDGLQKQYDAGEITLSALNAGISSLNIEESAALERNSDEQLANVLFINQQAIDAISTAISGLENAMSQSNDPAEITTLLQQIAQQIPEIYRLRREGLQKQYDAGEITLEALNASIANLNIEESAALEQNSDQQLANALSVNQENINGISTNIAELENRISQSNDPAEIASLLMQIAEQIPEIYQLRREALQAQYNANEITLDALNTGLAQLNIEESAELEQNSDAQLGIALREHNANIQIINNQVNLLSEQIRNSEDPAEIATLLVDLRAAITERYRLERELLQKRLDAEEILVSEYNAELGSIDFQETQALGRADTLAADETSDLLPKPVTPRSVRSVESIQDEALANALRVNQEAVDAVNAGISALENAISQSNDLAEIQTLLQQIAEQIPETYRLRREALQTQFNHGEITRSALNTGLANLDIEESAAIEQNADSQLANTLLINQEAIGTISVGIAELENRIAESNDLTEIQTLLTQIAEQIPEIYRLRREGLQSQYDAGEITLSELNTGIANLNIEESAALERNSDQQLANTLLINQQALEAISTEIAALENAIAQSNDLTEITTLLQQIAGQIPAIYRLRRESLQKQYDEGEITLEAFNTGIADLNIEEAAAIERNSDQQLANTLSINQQAVDSLNAGVSELENAISQSNDPAEIAALLTQIAEQIPDIYRVRREGLQEQYNEGEITLEALNTGITNLNIEESAAIEQNSDQQLANTLQINQQATETISTAIAGLENQIGQSNDPQEIARLLQQIAGQIPEIYRLRREALQKQYDAGEITLESLNSGIASLNIEESAQLETNSDQLLANAISEINTDAQLVNNEINSLSQQISDSDDPQEIANLAVDLGETITEKYRLQREILQKQLDAEEITVAQYNAELGDLSFQEGREIEGVGRLASQEVSDQRSTANNLIENAIQRAEFGLSQATSEQDFESRRQQLLGFVNSFYDAEAQRISNLLGSEQELQDLREDNTLQRERALLRIDDLENDFANERIRREERSRQNTRTAC